MGFRLLKDISLFMLIFSLINDNFVVEKVAGAFALKAIFGFFFIVNIQEIFRDFAKPKNLVIKSFYILIFVFATIVFINVMLQVVTLPQGLLVLTSVTISFIYVVYYENFDRLLYFIWASVAVSAIISLFNDPITQWTFRKTGGTGDPNEFALQLLATMFLTVYLFYKNKSHLFLWSSLGLFSYALLYAGSKSSFLTLAILSLFALVIKFGFLFKKLFSFKVLLGVLIIGIGLSIVNFSQMTAVKGMEKRAKTSGTAHTRFVSWNAGLRMAEDHFFTGVGVEQYEKHARQYATDYIAEGSFAPHNFLIKMIGENGIFPFLALVAFVMVLFSFKFRQIMKSNYFWIYLSSLSSVLMGLTLSVTYEKYFWIFLALLAHASIVIWIEEMGEGVDENNAYST